MLDRWWHDLKLQGDAVEVLNSWREEGYTHLLFHKVGADFIKEQESYNLEPGYTKNDWLQLEGLLSSLDSPVDFGGAYQLYTLSH